MHPVPARRLGAGNCGIVRFAQLRGARARRDPRRRHGRAGCRRPGQRQPGPAHQADLRAAGGEGRARARACRQGDHVRRRRPLAQARRPNGGDEVGHGRRRRCAGGHGRDRRASASSPRARRRPVMREHAGRQRLSPRRHHHGPERKDDRGHEHGRRGPANPRRRALARAPIRRDAPRRPRHADGRDGDRDGRLLRRALLERPRLGRHHPRGGGGERRPCLDLAAARDVPAVHRLEVRRHEEFLRVPPGLPHPRGPLSGGVRRRGTVGPSRHRRHGVSRARSRRLLRLLRSDRLRRAAARRVGRARLELLMDLDLSEEHELLRRTVREFAEERIAPVAEELDREHRFPYEIVAELAELGLMGIPFPEEYGGAGGDTLAYTIAIEELTRVDSSVAITVAAHTSLGTMPIFSFGTEDQKRRWLPDLASGRKLAAFGLTEPEAGSDAGATRTTAELRDGEWVVNGSKIFITNAGTDLTSCVTITARTGADEISNLIVPNGTAGYEISAPMKKMGWRASDTRELSFRDCAVPERNLLGERGKGFHQFLEILDGGRISVAAMGVGLAQGAYDLAVAYAKEREQFGRPIAQFQAVQFALADMAGEIEAGRALTYKAAWLKDQDRPFAKEAAMAKLFTGELSHRAANAALQIHGGYGFMEESPISRLYRDQKILEIGEGTNEVQRMVIARHLGLSS